MKHTVKPLLIAATLITLATAATTACSSAQHSTGAAPRPSPVASTPPSSVASTPLGSASSSAPTSDPTRAKPANGDCLETQLRASIDPRQIPGNGTKDANGATEKGVLVDFQNTSNSSCNLIGYPGAATVDAAGHQVTQATRALRGELDGVPAGVSTLPVVRLAPGKYADAMIEGVDTEKDGSAQAGCADTLPSILVTPPNTAIAVPFDIAWPACYSFDVHPVVALTTAP